MQMLVLANEMFDSPPVFAWVLPVFVRLKPGKEETLRTKCISAYLLSIGLDDQDPSQWDDANLSHLVVPDADYPSDSEEEGEEEEEEEEDQRGEGGGSATTVSRLVVPDPVNNKRGALINNRQFHSN